MVVEEAGEGEAHLAHLGGSSLSIDHSSPGSLRYSFGPLQPSSPPEVDPYFGTFLDRMASLYLTPRRHEVLGCRSIALTL